MLDLADLRDDSRGKCTSCGKNHYISPYYLYDNTIPITEHIVTCKYCDNDFTINYDDIVFILSEQIKHEKIQKAKVLEEAIDYRKTMMFYFIAFIYLISLHEISYLLWIFVNILLMVTIFVFHKKYYKDFCDSNLIYDVNHLFTRCNG